VTEELWGHLKNALQTSPLKDLAVDWPSALIIAPWPELRPEEGWEAGKVADFALIQEVFRTIRNLRAERKVSPAKRIPAVIVAGDKMELLHEQEKIISTMAGLDTHQVTIVTSQPVKPGNSIALVAGQVEIFIPLAGMRNLDEERKRLQKDLADVQVQIDRLEKLLGSDFANKAPAPVVQKERDKLVEFQKTAEKLRAQMI
jgi:valyl-tRNA synthetase